MCFKFDKSKSDRLKRNPNRGIDFEEAQVVWQNAYYLDQRSDWPEQFRAIGWVENNIFSIIFEIREDEQGEYYHLVTLWRATREERELYEKNG